MKPLNNPIVQSASVAMQEALKAGNEEALSVAFEQFTEAVVDSIRNDCKLPNNLQ